MDPSNAFALLVVIAINLKYCPGWIPISIRPNLQLMGGQADDLCNVSLEKQNREYSQV